MLTPLPVRPTRWRSVRPDGDRRRPPVDGRTGARAAAERGLIGLSLIRRDDEAALVRAALSGAVSGGGRLRVLVEAPAAADVIVRDLAHVLRGTRYGWARRVGGPDPADAAP